MLFRSVAAGAALGLAALTQGWKPLAAVAFVAAAILWGVFLRRIRQAHFGTAANMLAIFGLPLFAALLVRSHRHHQAGRSVEWKGRSYPQAGGGAEAMGPVRVPVAEPLETIR